jgi:hypothetical protein
LCSENETDILDLRFTIYEFRFTILDLATQARVRLTYISRKDRRVKMPEGRKRLTDQDGDLCETLCLGAFVAFLLI